MSAANPLLHERIPKLLFAWYCVRRLMPRAET